MSGIKDEQRNVAVLNTPGGLLDHNSKAVVDAFTRQMNEPIIAVHNGVLYINGHPQPKGTVSLTELFQAMRTAPPAQRGGKRRTKKTT